MSELYPWLQRDLGGHDSAAQREQESPQRVRADAARLNGLHPKGESVLAAAESEPGTLRARMLTGGVFVFDETLDAAPLVGSAEAPLWARGEPFLLTASPGVGKTTLAQRVVLAQIGVTSPELLGMRVDPVRRVLYLAMDRPRQIARSFRRMVDARDRALLDARVVVWKGPPPADIAKMPDLLLRLAREADADIVYVDSLKDAAVGLSGDDVGAGVNAALQHVVAGDVDLCVLHHQVKRGPDGRKPKQLADVYGSTWITAGAGSVALLDGDPDSETVTLHHLKSVAEPVGPLVLRFDRNSGDVTLADENVDALDVLRRRHAPVSVLQLAAQYAATEGVELASKHRSRARRELDRLLARALVVKIDDGSHGGTGGSSSALYALRTDETLMP